ncbi:unnamed protein product [Clonostachys chloroleuca]|uniref:Uncharacterized protein n=1 Tax=Clonostachys chloroleuca TaxID=1926264 RepID=A0AA35LPX4_9HYPO|nr:unnamed protein product [Clonostachys chloroleuca]
MPSPAPPGAIVWFTEVFRETAGAFILALKDNNQRNDLPNDSMVMVILWPDFNGNFYSWIYNETEDR